MKSLLSVSLAVVSSLSSFTYAGDFDVMSRTSPALICQRLLTQTGFNPIADDQASINKFNASIQKDQQETKKQAAALLARAEYLKKQLALPDEQRDQKDPRWFLSLRNPDNNPVTESLKSDVKTHDSLLKIFKRIEDAKKGIETAHVRNSADVGFLFYPVIQEWLHVRLAEVIAKVAKTDFSKMDKNSLATFRWEVDSVLQDVESFAKTKDGDKADTKLIRDFMKVAQGKLNKFAETWVKENMGAHSYHYGDAQVIIALALQHNETLVEVLQKYKKTKKALDKLEFGGLLPDVNVALLSVQLRFNLDEATVVKRYFEIMKSGRVERLSEISIDYQQAQVLTGLSFEQNTPAKQITEIFFGIREIAEAQSRKEETGWFRDHIIGHGGLTILTRLALEHRLSKQQLEKILTRFSKFIRQGSERMEYLGINDLAVALLLEEEKRADGVDMMDQYTTVFNQFKREDRYYPDFSNEMIARMATFTVFYKITPAILHQAFQHLEPLKLSAQNRIAIVGLALNDPKVHAQVLAGNFAGLTKTVDVMASIPWLVREREEFGMHDTKGKSVNDIAKDRAKRETEYRSAIGYDRDDRPSSPERLFIPGLVVDHNGHTHVTMGLGGGFSVDVQSKDIRYTSGGFSYSLNGAESGLKGLGVKLF